MPNPQTQDFLNEAKTPGVANPAAIRTGLLAALAPIGDMGEQAARWKRALQAASLAEEDEAVRAHFEELLQTFGALERSYAELSRHIAEAQVATRQFERYDAALRESAAEKGYTV